MQTQPQNEDAKNLAERINADLAQPQRKPEDGKPLATEQIQIEMESLSAIEARAALRKAAGQGVDTATDEQLVAADLQAFKRIENLALQESAAVSIADNARAYPAYKQALEKGTPAHPNAAAQIAALDAANTERVNAKEEAKWIEAQATLLEREARTKKWTQDDAQKQAQADGQAFQKAQDRAERYALLDEIKFNAKANLAYKASLEATAPAIAARISATEKKPVEIPQKPQEVAIKTAAAEIDEATGFPISPSTGKTLTATEGWKLHLNTGTNDALATKISDFLTAQGVEHKTGNNGGQAGKGMTVYIGSRAATNALATQLNSQFGADLLPAEGEVLKDDIPIAGKVWGRFEIGRKDTDFHQYGSQGVSFFKEDMEQLKYAPDRAAAIEAAKTRADAALTARYGDYYAGTPTIEIDQRTKEMVLDTLALNRVAELRKRDSEKVREAFAMNSIELSLKKDQVVSGNESRPEAAPAVNKVESDEIFAAGKADVKPIVPAEIEKQFLRVGDRFYHPKNKELVAFEDKGNRLETKSNSENIALTLVLIAEARGWDEIKVSGSETFRREVWLDAAARSMQVKGYTPTEQDKVVLGQRLGTSNFNNIEPENKPVHAREAELEKQTKATQQAAEKPSTSDKPGSGAVVANTPERLDKAAVALNTLDKKNDSPKGALMFGEMAKAFTSQTPEEAAKKFPALASAAAALKVVEKKAEADGLNAEQRAIITARARENIAGKIERGNLPKFSVNEKIEVNRDRVQDRGQER